MFARSYIRTLLYGKRRSSAGLLKARLSKSGIQPKDIHLDHVIQIYKSMRRTSDAPDFALPGDLFADAKTNRIDEQRPVCGVIIETRSNVPLVPIVLNFIRNLQIPVQIFHGLGNSEQLKFSPLAGLIDDRKVLLTPLRVDSLGARKYNTLLLEKTFWDHLACRNKLLFFQTDGISCNNSSYKIDEFLEFDYIGSKWPRRRPPGLIIDGGNGGVSLRDWKKCYDCLSRFPPSYWNAGEDGYFAFHIELIGGRVGNNSDCAKFGSQYEFSEKSLFGHNIACLSNRDREAFMRYCGDAKLILGND